MNSKESIHVISPLEEHSHTVIFLHGRDRIASEFASEFFESQASDDRTLPEIFPRIKWVFPTSKLRVSARFETEMSQWFDIWSVEKPSKREELQKEGLSESVAHVLNIIRSEMLLVPADHLILCGISQGCSTAIYALLCGAIRLGAFIGLSTWLPFQDKIEDIARQSAAGDLLHDIRALFKDTTNNLNITDLSNLSLDAKTVFETAVFISHSEDDDVVPVRNGKRLYLTLKELGFTVSWHAYADGGHWINEPQGVDDIVRFLKASLVI